jgi:hypothetical protein
MNGRVYDYALGRFLGVDPFIQFPGNSQSLNPYSYILNNPLAGTDPTGYAVCDIDADKSCLEDGVNTITENGKEVRTVVVGNAGDSVTISNSSGSISGVIGKSNGAGFLGDLKKEPSEIGALANRVNGDFVATAATRGLGGDAKAGQIFDFAEEEQFEADLASGKFSGAVESVHPELFLFGGPGGKAGAEVGGAVLEGVVARAGIRSATKATAAEGKAVLGHFPEYTRLAESLGARRFNVPEAVWNNMSATERWAANQKFLDRLISRGDEIILATPLDKIRPSSFFARELEYLASKGYVPSADGTRLIRP